MFGMEVGTVLVLVHLCMWFFHDLRVDNGRRCRGTPIQALPSDKVQTWQQLAACQRQVPTLNADFTKIPSEAHARLGQIYKNI